jgi:hypothetical protein
MGEGVAAVAAAIAAAVAAADKYPLPLLNPYSLYIQLQLFLLVHKEFFHLVLTAAI